MGARIRRRKISDIHQAKGSLEEDTVGLSFIWLDPLDDRGGSSNPDGSARLVELSILNPITWGK
jgi:hypothetical protein